MRTALNRFINKFLKTILPHGTIFLYHRVANVSDDPHKLSVSPVNFREQLKYIKENYQVIALKELAGKVLRKEMKRGLAAITFDDGYADNLYTALPILEEFGLPATIFVMPGAFFWQDRTKEEDRGRNLTKEELLKLADHPLVEIGAHTMTHPNLAKISAERQQEEIAESKKTLERILGKRAELFAYPFGSKDAFTEETEKIVRKNGFLSAVSTMRRNVFHFSNPFALPRINIRNCDISEFKHNIANV